MLPATAEIAVAMIKAIRWWASSMGAPLFELHDAKPDGSTISLYPSSLERSRA